MTETVKEIEFTTETEGETFLLKAAGNKLQVFFKKKEISPPDPIGDGETEQTITVTKTLITEFEKPV